MSASYVIGKLAQLLKFLFLFLYPAESGTDLGGGCRGCAPPSEMTCGFLIQLVFCKKKKSGLLVLK